MEGKVPVWRMLHEGMEALGGFCRRIDLRDWVLAKYPGTNLSTINTQIGFCMVNSPSRWQYPGCKARICPSNHLDFLYQPSRESLELYDPAKHGVWEIREAEGGKFEVGICDVGSDPGDLPSEPSEIAESYAFAQEAHLRDFLASHLELLEIGLTLEPRGVEYRTGVGPIDILARDGAGGYVVIELKVGRGPDSVAGQILRYVNWVRIHLAQGKAVRGIIVAQVIPETVLYSIASDPSLSARQYELEMKLSSPITLASSP